MSLTLKAEQQLKDVGLIAFFEKDKAPWIKAAKETYAYLKVQFAPNPTVRPDDVASVLADVLQVNTGLKKYLRTKKLHQRYWYVHFADLILDREWDQVIK